MKNPASVVPASQRGASYGHGTRACPGRLGWAGTKDRFASGRWALTGSRPSADVTFIMLRVADFAAALLDGLFEQPAGDPVPARDFPQPGISVVSESFLNHSLRTLW
ncbi:protein of unknown function [Nitrospira defluvii]|uniref:Uncharacterized protein n=1 Tax=Nitrospira defluvii TaxID=330214 RepID=D8PHI3_9BACT|nr:protein of unknown function [Nitrospira defluvii]